MINWIKNNLHPDGGVRAWPGGPAYPEVTGYLIPTLLDYEENELANDFVGWLMDIQNDDGSFDGLDGVPRSFDTAAVMEGLECFHCFDEILKAQDFLYSMVRKDGAMRIAPGSDETHLYTMRVSAFIGSVRGLKYWIEAEWPETREHYIAYALEGLWNFCEKEIVKQKLQERDWRSDDLCANAQFAILHHQAGLDASPFVNLVESHRGDLSNSWTAKWILDMWRVIDNV